ncbi:MAG: ABC transporter permease [bacterium]|nr:ABC transporter permease [bacterium]
MPNPPRRIPSSSQLGSVIVWTAGAVGLLFLAVPIGALLLRAVQSRAWEAAPEAGVATAMWLTLASTAFTLLFTVLFGTPLAFVFARYTFRGKRLLNVLIELPIVMPPAVAGLALLVTFGRRGLFGPVLRELDLVPVFTLAAVVMAQIFVAAPFYVRAAQLGFQNVPREIEDAARVDGAGSWRMFLYVTLPLASRALSAGLILCWARALSEFGATILFAGNNQNDTRTLTLLVYTLFEGDLNAAVWVGLLLIGLALVALLLSQWVAQSAAQGAAQDVG